MPDLSQLTPEEVDAMIAELQAKLEQPPVQSEFEQKSAEVEQDIASRQDTLGQNLGELTQAGQDIATGERGIGSLAIPAVKTGFSGIQRAVAGVANPLLDIQEAHTTDEPRSLKDIRAGGEDTSLKGIMERGGLKGLARTAKTSIAGLKGERLGTIADVPAKAGFGPISSFLIEAGTIAALTGGLSPKTTSGKILRAGEKGVKKIMPRWMGKNFTYKHAVTATQRLDKNRTILGKAVGGIMDDVVVKSKQVDPSLIIDDFVKLGDKALVDVATKMRDPIYNIKSLADGTLDLSVDNMWRVNQLLDDFMTSGAWREAGKTKQKIIKNLYGKISSAMKKAAPQIRQPFEAYSKYMDDYRLVSQSLRKNIAKRAKPVLTPGRARATLRSKSDDFREAQMAWDRVAKKDRVFRHAKKSLEAYTRRKAQEKAVMGLAKSVTKETAKTIAKGVIGGTAAGIAGAKAFRAFD